MPKIGLGFSAKRATHLQQPSPGEFHPEKHHSYRLQNPSVHLSFTRQVSGAVHKQPRALAEEILLRRTGQIAQTGLRNTPP